MSEARSNVQIDGPSTRVTRWDLPPGTRIDMHVHEYDYVVVPLTDGVMTIATADGERIEVPIATGASYARSAGVEHEVANLTSGAISFVEIELLDHPITPTPSQRPS